jgi:Flp pilus assembly protein TadG
MNIWYIRNRTCLGQHGAVAVYVAIILVSLIGFTALAVDVGHLYGVKNELHNAADAGSLAGAHELFDDDGNLTVAAAVAEAERITPLNSTGNVMVDVNNITVETGHWSFTSSQFTASENTTQVEWQERPFSELDLDPAFINAVRVVAQRPDTPSFFARIFSLDEFFVSSEAVAYIGFAGTLHPEDLDQPIAICKESITDPLTGAYTCNMGRMLNSGNVQNTSNTGTWTNFTQPCDTANTQTMRPLICADGNPNEVQFGEGIGATGGVQDTTLDDLVDCWLAATEGKVPWSMTLPVVECPGNNVSNCAPLVGAVNVHILWIIHKNDPHFDDVPREMTVSGDTPTNWSCAPGIDGFTCWKSFVDQFNLQNVEGPPESDEDYEEMYQKKNIFFLPDCTVHEPVGKTGGENFGILAEIPVLVK